MYNFSSKSVIIIISVKNYLVSSVDISKYLVILKPKRKGKATEILNSWPQEIVIQDTIKENFF